VSKLDRFKKLTAGKSKEEPRGRDAKSQLLSNSVSESKSEVVATAQTQSEAHQQAETKMKSESKQEPKTKTKLQSKSKTESNANSQSISHAEQQAKTQTEKEPKMKSDVKTDHDPAAELFSLAKQGSGKQRMEDIRKRRTYWLTDEEIQMIDELAKMTGKDKYEVVGLAVQSMYYRLQSEIKKD
jgi:hypothetical protein